jgi:hypothetical protein
VVLLAAAGDAAAPHADQDALQPHTSTGSVGATLYDAKCHPSCRVLCRAVLCCAVAAGDAVSPHADQDALQPHTSTGSIGDTLYEAKETTVSGASVAVLILWTIAVTGWTGFQVGGGGNHVGRGS